MKHVTICMYVSGKFANAQSNEVRFPPSAMTAVIASMSLLFISPTMIVREERIDQAAYMTLNKNLIEPLMDWKFINVEKVGSRRIVSLTDEGINALRFLHDINIVKDV
jgi:hypothetical protein